MVHVILAGMTTHISPPLALILSLGLVSGVACNAAPAGSGDAAKAGVMPGPALPSQRSKTVEAPMNLDQKIVAPSMVQGGAQKIVAPSMVQGGAQKIVAPSMVQGGAQKIVAPDMIQGGAHKVPAPNRLKNGAGKGPGGKPLPK